MGNISITDAQGKYTKYLAAQYSDFLKPKSFLRSFFKEDESNSKEISIMVQRGQEYVAVDVLRSSEANRNVFSRTSEKIFEPPYFYEKFDSTKLQSYDLLFTGSGEVPAKIFGRFMRDVGQKMSVQTDMIDRAYELYCSQVLHTGVLQLQAGTNIDFKRKTLSKVVLGAGAWWSVGGVDPNTAMLTGCQWLRDPGKMAGGNVTVIMGSNAFKTYMANAAVQARGAIFNYSMDNLQPAQRNAAGGNYHGWVSVGGYRCMIWSYDEVYTDRSGNSQPYIDPDSVIMIPETPTFLLQYAAVPQLLPDGGIMPMKGKFIFNDWMDIEKTAHWFAVKSAGMPIPLAVDQIYTIQVLE